MRKIRAFLHFEIQHSEAKHHNWNNETLPAPEGGNGGMMGLKKCAPLKNNLYPYHYEPRAISGE